MAQMDIEQEQEERLLFENLTRKGRVAVDYVDHGNGTFEATDNGELLNRWSYVPRAIRIEGGQLIQNDLAGWPAEIQLHPLPLERWAFARLRHSSTASRRVGLLYVQGVKRPDGKECRRLHFHIVDSPTARERAQYLGRYATADEELRAEWLRQWKIGYFEDIPIAEGSLGVVRELDGPPTA